MLIITLKVNAPPGQAIGICIAVGSYAALRIWRTPCGYKEDAAMYFERFGDTRVVSVTETAPEQLNMFNNK